ncbi:MAG: NAD(P)/FAD-dependent oxidoreductase, partial [Spirosomaceae bacterium]|nr:NAD(P)/FAD-dependent oxidoreductase [Spirosomataceae bacterium]
VIDLLKSTLTKEQFLDLNTLAKYIKNFPVKITAPGSIDEAISTSGGISLTAVNSDFELKTIKNHFCIGEMLDWNAPTGGYLIQACASMGVSLARKLNEVEL